MFIRVASVADVPDPGRLLIEVDDTPIALLHAGGTFYALDDVCTHDGGPLVDGVLTNNDIACPRHGAKFDLKTGKALSMPATKPTRVHQVEIRNGEVFVQLND
jgi:3-phenylpropionate/trans-cinnamate dioxygenase ferredoxin component